MPAQEIRIRAADGGDFGCYLALPATSGRVPAVVLASAIHGVDSDLRAIADEFASHGFLAAAPDLFWRSTPGPLARGDPRAAARAQPRLERIEAGEQDLADVLRELRKLAAFNGQAAVIGFCYGGPYAILGPRHLGYAAGIACHGSQMLDFLPDIEGLERPVCLVFGDQDHLAPAAVREAYRAVAARRQNVAVHVLPQVRHGFMMRSNAAAFDPEAYGLAMGCALALLRSLGAPARIPP